MSFHSNLICLNNNFIKSLTQKYHSDLRMKLENENWKSANIPYDFKQTLETIFNQKVDEVDKGKSDSDFEKKYNQMIDAFFIEKTI